MAMDLLKFAHEVKWRDMSRSVCTGWLRSLSLPQHLLLLALTPLPFLLAAFSWCMRWNRRRPMSPRGWPGAWPPCVCLPPQWKPACIRRPQQLEQIVDALGDADNVTALAIYDHSGRPLVERAGRRSPRGSGFARCAPRVSSTNGAGGWPLPRP